MILHTVNKPAAWNKCEGLIDTSDVVLLLEDGVYLALESDTQCFAISADIDARGLRGKIKDNVSLIDYDQFVELTLRADKVCAWF
ncbi:MAG: sulfurtransferase complex subunit TusB [Gammaproteobacteria bacterium]|jgi:tRNA 2-thiouridine synthesizing protein B|nr:sulfurtransferase complex subunit TusB [Gammaproteobacteria bacterium]MBT7370779.1 sulfurtransferase complex subunit TusB [Gammaproteobacteria bacterium]